MGVHRLAFLVEEQFEGNPLILVWSGSMTWSEISFNNLQLFSKASTRTSNLPDWFLLWALERSQTALVPTSRNGPRDPTSSTEARYADSDALALHCGVLCPSRRNWCCQCKLQRSVLEWWALELRYALRQVFPKQRYLSNFTKMFLWGSYHAPI